MTEEAYDLVVVGDAVFSVREDHIDIEIAVTNTTDRPIYVGCGARQIRYDPERHSLDFWMSDRGPVSDEPHSRCRQVTTPRTVTIDPGETQRISQSTPLLLTRIFDDGSGQPDFEQIDLTQTSQVTVHSFVAERKNLTAPVGGCGSRS